MISQEQFRSFLIHTCASSVSDSYLVGVSGGMDSVMLCDLLAGMKIDFAIAHVNFGLRGKESDGDEEFVAGLAKKLNVPLYLHRCDEEDFISTGENSMQVAARNIRYAFFEQARKQHGYKKIMTAHHKDDSIETALMNFARGSGLTGLMGILPYKNLLVRPLLFATREEIHVHAKEKKLEWREDSSNATDNYTRNKFRHHLLPWLKEEIPQSYKGFRASFENLEEAQRMIWAAVKNWSCACLTWENNERKISIEKLLRYVEAEWHLRFFLKDFGFKNTKAGFMVELVESPVGTELVSPTHRLIRDRDFLFLVERISKSPENSGAFSFEQGIFTGEIPEEKWSALIDALLVTSPLEARTWQEGDKLIPFGMKGHKNVSDILNEMKLPAHKKENAQVIFSGNEIVWVPGYRIADKFRVTEETSSVIFLKFNPEKHGA